MKRYIGTKIIKAEPMNLVDAEEMLGRKIQPGNEEGYLVEYEDGYRSWSPKEAFEKAYWLTDGMTFGLAVEAMKAGEKVSRAGWNAKGMFVYIVSADIYPAKMEAIKGCFDKDMVPYGTYIAMKTAKNNVMPWTPSQCDVLAEDWCLVD